MPRTVASASSSELNVGRVGGALAAAAGGLGLGSALAAGAFCLGLLTTGFVAAGAGVVPV